MQLVCNAYISHFFFVHTKTDYYFLGASNLGQNINCLSRMSHFWYVLHFLRRLYALHGLHILHLADYIIFSCRF